VSQLSTDDRLAIQETITRYAHALDAGRWDQMASLFAPDSRLDVGPMGAYDGPDGVRRFGDLLGSMGLTMRHYVTNVLITGDGGRAHARVYVLAFTGEPGAQRPATGFYEDDLVKQDGRWLFRERRVLLDVPKS
jgi:SnoaL-like protein